jgi:hypothetical protein
MFVCEACHPVFYDYEVASVCTPIAWGTPVAARLVEFLLDNYDQLNQPKAELPEEFAAFDASWVLKSQTPDVRRLSRNYAVACFMLWIGHWPGNTTDGRRWLEVVYASLSKEDEEKCREQEANLLLCLQRVVDYITQDDSLYYAPDRAWGNYTFLSTSRERNLRRKETRPARAQKKTLEE